MGVTLCYDSIYSNQISSVAGDGRDLEKSWKRAKDTCLDPLWATEQYARIYTEVKIYRH